MCFAVIRLGPIDDNRIFRYVLSTLEETVFTSLDSDLESGSSKIPKLGARLYPSPHLGGQKHKTIAIN